MIDIRTGDCREVLRTMPDESVHCCVTSPPYWGLRDYGHAGQLGLERTPEEYVANMVAVFRGVRRVLREDGTLWLNLGDSYCSTAPGTTVNAAEMTGKHVNKDRYQRPDTPCGLKPKDLVGIPWRVAFALQADGWYLRQDIIWHKPNPMPESVTDRCTKAHEYLFMLSKSARYHYDADAIAEPQSTPMDTKAAQSFGAAGGKAEHVYGQKVSGEKWKPNGTRNKRDVWTIPTKPYKGAHFAVFPPALVRPCILAGCPQNVCSECGAGWKRVVEKSRTFESGSGKSGNPIQGKQGAVHGGGETKDIRRGPCVHTATIGWRPTCACGEYGVCATDDMTHKGAVSGTVLDPFGGAGTTALVAEEEGRNSILIELNPEYAEMARKRTAQRGLFCGQQEVT